MAKKPKKIEKPKTPRKRGRPTKFKEEFCDMLVEHMAEGYSYESFAGVISVTRSRLYVWEKEYPIFKDAKFLGREKCLLFWERIGRAGAMGEIKGFNCATWIFQMKNRFQWRNEVTIHETKRIESVKIELPSANRVETIDLVEGEVEE